MKKTLLSLATASALGLVSLSAQAAPTLLDFTVAEGSVAGALDNTFVADKINGGYEELLTINADFSFDTVAFASMGQFFRNEGANVVTPTQIGCLGANCYNLYAVFTSSGTFGGGTFTGTSGAFDLFLDVDQDTTYTFGLTGADPLALAGDGEDVHLGGTAALTSAIGLLGNPGAFDLFFKDFTLTAAGSAYFIEPDPFHLLVNVDGDFDNFVAAPGNITVVGDVSAVFVVPEPATLALVGLGLLGAGVASRRKQKA